MTILCVRCHEWAMEWEMEWEVNDGGIINSSLFSPLAMQILSDHVCIPQWYDEAALVVKFSAFPFILSTRAWFDFSQ